MIHVFDSTMPGAPVLSGTAGTLLAVLRACLVDGWGATPVNSLSITDGVATLEFAGTHPFKRMSVLGLTGASVSALNAKHKVLSVTVNTVTFAAPEGVEDGAVGGTMSAKLSPAGWVMPFYDAGAHKGVFARAVPEATDMVLRVDDSGTTTARVRGFEDMSNIDTGTGPFPTDAQVSGGLYWFKSHQANTSARAWCVIACEQWFYFYSIPNTTGAGNNGVVHGFGDPLARKTGDAYACLLAGSTAGNLVSTSAAPTQGCLSMGNSAVANSGKFVARISTALGGSDGALVTAGFGGGVGFSGTSGYGGFTLPYPNTPGGGLLINEAEVITSEGVRARMPGLHHSPQTTGDAFATGELVDVDGSAQVLMALRVAPTGAAANSNTRGTVFVDVLGPWREVSA